MKQSRQMRRFEQRANFKAEEPKFKGDVAWALLVNGIRNNSRRRRLQKYVRRYTPAFANVVSTTGITPRL